MAERVLVITAQYPAPVRSGGQVRAVSLLRSLGSRFSVTVVGLRPASGEPRPGPLDGCEVSLPVDATIGWKRPVRRLREIGPAVIRGVPPSLARYRQLALQRAIASLGVRDSFDAIICQYTAAGSYLPPAREGVLAVLDEVDVSWVPVQRRARASRGLRRAVSQLHANWLYRYEARLFRSFDVVVVASDRDGRRVSSAEPGTPVWTVPNGVSAGELPDHPLGRRAPAFVFLGGMPHDPNRDAVSWLIAQILPRLRAKLPAVDLLLIGEGTQQLSDPARGVRGLGFQSDLSHVLAPGDVAIAPIRIGGGTRLKLLDFMARGIPTVSTAIGAEGLDAVPDEHLVIADQADEIAAHAVRLFRSPGLGTLLAKRARRFVEERYDWDRIGEAFGERLAQAIHEHRSSGHRASAAALARAGARS